MKRRTWLACLFGIVVAAGSGPALAVDTKPNSFSLANATVFKGSRGLPGASHLTKPVTVQGIDAPSPISISGPGQYSINGASFRTSSATVRRGDRVVVRLKASNTYDANVATTLAIGGVKASFSLRTVLNPSRTLKTVSGTTAFVYRNTSPAKLSSFVYKPSGWRAGDRRPAMVCFFGGGWLRGDPVTRPFARGMAMWATSQGMVAITPDYRTNERFATTPLHAVDDGRAALRWAQDNHAKLGIDPARIVTCGNSVGGAIALWTSIAATPAGSSPTAAPALRPVATVLVSSVVDTSPTTGYAPDLLGANALSLSPLHQLSRDMPPTLMFHGTADADIPYSRADHLCDELLSDGNVCELVTLNGAGHNWFTDNPSLRQPTYDRVESFLRQLGVLN